eukprot:3043297-Alexandrium_andersonii.AAC.1
MDGLSPGSDAKIERALALRDGSDMLACSSKYIQCLRCFPGKGGLSPGSDAEIERTLANVGMVN